MRALVLVLLLCGCAESRYLTKAQDDEMRKACEPDGCTVMPNTVLQQLMQIIRGEAI